LMDDAGNVSNTSGIVICIDFDKLSIRVLDLGFLAGQERSEYEAVDTDVEYSCTEETGNYDFEVILEEYTCEELV